MAGPKLKPPTGFVLDGAPTDASTPPPPPAGFEADAPVDDKLIVDVTGGYTPSIKLPADQDPEAFKKGLTDLFQKGAPSDDIKAYVKAAGAGLPETADEDVFKPYEANGRVDRAKGFPDKPMYLPFNVEPLPPQTKADDAAWGGIRASATLGADDELGGLGGAIGNALGRTPGVNSVMKFLTGKEFDKGTGDGFWADYERERSGEDRTKSAEWDQHPLAYGTGYALGLIPGTVLPAARFANLGRAGRVAGGVGTGAFYGGVGGAMNAEPGSRVEGGENGAMAGGVGGLVLPPIAQFLGRQGGRLVRAVTPSRNALNSGLDALADRMPRADIEAIPGNVADIRAAGVSDPRLLDVVGETGRGVVRAAVPRSGPARTAAADAATNAYVDSQDRIASHARGIIGGAENRTNRQIAADVQAQRDAIADSGASFRSVASEPVTMTPEVEAVLKTPEGQKALLAARSLMSPDERAQIDGVMKAVRTGKLGGGYPESVQKLIDQLPAGLSPAARDSAIAQITRGVAPEPAVTLTVDMVDKLSRSLLGRGRSNANPGLGRVSINMGTAVRNAARDQNRVYAKSLDDYAQMSSVADAATGEGRFADGDFLKSPTDQYGPTVANADTTPPNLEAMLPADAPQAPIPSQLDALRARAQTQVTDAATNSPADAYRIANRLSTSSAQGDRNAALLGPRRADQLRDTMGVEARRVANSRYIDERVGSKTAGVMGDEETELINLIPNALKAATGGSKWEVVKGVTKWLSGNRIRGVDAERLVRNVISTDQDSLDRSVEYLVSRGLRRDNARTLVRSIAATTAGMTAAGAQGSNPPPPGTLSIKDK